MKEKRQRTKKRRSYYQKRRRTNRGSKRQRGGFLNRYEFTYAGRDTVNQATKVAPGVIKGAADDINNVAEQRINQIISKSGAEVETVLPKILKGVIEDVYRTPFRLLGNFGKQQLNKLKRKIFRQDTTIVCILCLQRSDNKSYFLNKKPYKSFSLKRFKKKIRGGVCLLSNFLQATSTCNLPLVANKNSSN